MKKEFSDIIRGGKKAAGIEKSAGI